MANWASPKERFVEVPGVVEIRWVSDDPDYYVRPFDLFDQQATNEGLPDWYGKKDKATTEQAYFTCNVCECDLKSVVTLRAHCKGTQHIRKALQKKKEYRDSQKLLKKQQEGTKEETTEDCKTLFECLEQTSEPAVGLENITEYKSTKSSTPYYHCNLEGCFNEQGDCHQMNRHIMVFRHKQSWLRSKLGVAPQHSSEINQKIAEYTKDYKRDYRLIKIVEDDDLWKKCKKSQIRAPRVDRQKEEPEEKVEIGREKRDSWEERRSGGRDDWERERSSLGREERERRDDRSTWERERISRGREEGRNGDTEERRDRISRPREERRSWKREGSYENGDSKRKRSRSRERSSRPNYRSRSRERERSCERWNGREVKVDRDALELDRSTSRDDYRDDHRRSRYSEERERDRRGDVDRNRKSENGFVRSEQNLRVEEDHRISKRERDDREDGLVRNSTLGHNSASSSNQPRNAESSQLQYQEKTQEDEIILLHRKVAECVKKRLNMYWAHIETTEPKNRKINDAEEYTKLAKKFSHEMRDQIKETYEQYERTLEGITLTADNKEQIKTAIDMHFESKPVIKLEGYRR